MRLLLKRFMAILCVLAFVSASTASFAATGTCAHEHSHAGTQQEHHHHDSGCLACCLGACAAVPALPSPVAVSPVIFTKGSAAYWESTARLDSRSIAPDPDPPRIQI
ncbi:MAG: hypothetical protein B7Z80_20065 [Rhodospirillales bacterium 20-64-7]|nr:MAG: hypothetical protein B7Z80_20065 [Rhodospirillales bacterium 20-64-7]